MDRDTAIGILRANEPDLRRLGVRHAALFGSVARGEGHADSDLDVMIEIDRGIIRDVYDYVGITQYITGLFSMPVDVVSRDMLGPYIRPSAERDAIHAF